MVGRAVIAFQLAAAFLGAGQQQMSSATFNDGAQHSSSAAVSQTPPARAGMAPMPLVAPLFLENSTTSSVLTLVQDLATPVDVDVRIDDRDGNSVTTFPERIPEHGQRAIAMGEKLEKLHIDRPIVGSLFITPHVADVTLGAQLSLIVTNNGPPVYIEEELVMLNDSSKANMFRAVATDAIGTPVLAIRSLASKPQLVIVTCLVEGRPPVNTALNLGRQKMTMVRPCDDHQPEKSAAPLDTPEDTGYEAPKAVGISVESNAPPESLVVYGVAPRTSRSYEPLAFLQVGMLHSASAVYPGVPLGPTAPLASEYFQPQIGLTNFGSTTGHVTIAYASEAMDDHAAHVISTVAVSAQSSKRVAIENIVGDSALRNSFTISADGPIGQIVSTLRSVALPTRNLFVDIPNQDQMKSTNGGQHPWRLDATSDSYLVLFNSNKETQLVGVNIYDGALTHSRAISLQAGQTTSIDLRSVIHDAAPSEESGHSSATGGTREGLVTWATLESNQIFGKLLDIPTNGDFARSFSCPIVYIACAATVSPSTIGVAVGYTSGQINGYANVCPSSGQCTCNGSGSCTGSLQTAPSPYWSLTNAFTASINGSGPQITLSGTSVGTTTLSLSVHDSHGCYGSSDARIWGVPGTVKVTAKPNHIKVLNDTFGPQSCPAGSSSYEIDGSNNQAITAPLSIREHFDGKFPSNGTSTCNNSSGTTTETCTAMAFNSVGFIDGISPGCASSSAPTSCGYVWTNQAWYYCDNGGRIM